MSSLKKDIKSVAVQALTSRAKREDEAGIAEEGGEASHQLKGRVSTLGAEPPPRSMLTGGLRACGSQAWDARCDTSAPALEAPTPSLPRVAYKSET